jgi:hypothetical protein
MVMKFLDPVPDIETVRIIINDETIDAVMWARTRFYMQIRLFKSHSKRASVSDLHRAQYGSGSSNLHQSDPPETDPDPDPDFLPSERKLNFHIYILLLFQFIIQICF